MITLRFFSPEGEEQIVQAAEGISVMTAATQSCIPGINGDCGGNLSCATCHCYIDAAWRGKLAPPSDMELAMLDGALDVTEDSRLTCQIRTSAELDGMSVRIPPIRY